MKSTVRRLLHRASLSLRATLGLRREDIPTTASAVAQVLSLLVVGIMISLGFASHWSANPELELIGMLLVTGGIGFWLTTLITSVVYGFPTRSDTTRDRLLLRHPILLLLPLGTVLHLTSMLSREAMVAFNMPDYPVALTVLAAVSLMMAAAPFYLSLFHLLRLVRSARQTRGGPAAPIRLARAVYAWPLRVWRDDIVPIMQALKAARNKG